MNQVWGEGGSGINSGFLGEGKSNWVRRKKSAAKKKYPPPATNKPKIWKSNSYFASFPLYLLISPSFYSKIWGGGAFAHKNLGGESAFFAPTPWIRPCACISFLFFCCNITSKVFLCDFVWNYRRKYLIYTYTIYMWSNLDMHNETYKLWQLKRINLINKQQKRVWSILNKFNILNIFIQGYIFFVLAKKEEIWIFKKKEVKEIPHRKIWQEWGF